MQTIYTNGKVYIERNQFEQAVLVESGLVVATGTNAAIAAMAPSAEVVDLEGRTLIPGFNDSHLHVLNLGNSLRMVRLGEVTSLQGLVDISREFLQRANLPNGKPLFGRGWNQDYFTDEVRMPTRHDLDKITTERPVMFTRACGHVVVCNTRALEVCGITAETPQVFGGQHDLDENGQPNGIFRELARSLLAPLTPQATVEDITESYKTAIAYANSFGITSVQTNDVHGENFNEVLAATRNLNETGALNARFYHQCCFMSTDDFKEFLNAGYRTGVGNNMDKIGPLKLFTDGSLGARTALMREDYADEAGTRGIATLTQEEINSIMALAAENNMQVVTHCIGDKAIEMMLDGFATVIENGQNPLRHGIVHCQITDMPLIDRFLENDILALVQPIFIHYDMHVVAERVGEKLASTSYAFGTMGRKGIHVSYGTDCPVEDLNTFNNIYCAVTRKDLRGNPSGAWHPEEKVDIYTAIDNYTAESAYAAFEENVKGRILPGYYADFAVLDQDIFTIPEEELRSVQVDMTVVGGRVVYTR